MDEQFTHIILSLCKKNNREMKTYVSSFPIVFCFFETLIFGCKFGGEPCNLLKISKGCGAGGNRTRVQTRKPYAFYTLIPDFDFRATARPGPPTGALSPKSHHDNGACHDYSRFSCAAEPSDSEQHPWSDVSSCHLVTGLSQ